MSYCCGGAKYSGKDSGGYNRITDKDSLSALLQQYSSGKDGGLTLEDLKGTYERNRQKGNYGPQNSDFYNDELGRTRTTPNKGLAASKVGDISSVIYN